QEIRIVQLGNRLDQLWAIEERAEGSRLVVFGFRAQPYGAGDSEISLTMFERVTFFGTRDGAFEPHLSDCGVQGFTCPGIEDVDVDSRGQWCRGMSSLRREVKGSTNGKPVLGLGGNSANAVPGAAGFLDGQIGLESASWRTSFKLHKSLSIA